MSTDNYTIESLKKSLVDILSRKKRFSFEIKSNYELYSSILKVTNFLNQNVTLCERVYCILNDIHEVKICPTCNKNPVKFKSMNRGYLDHCCSKCSKLDSLVNEKQKNTCLKKYGIDNPFKSKEVRGKALKTNIERYGVKNPMKSRIVQEKFH